MGRNSNKQASTHVVHQLSVIAMKTNKVQHGDMERWGGECYFRKGS